jgi:hypothetical protein
LVLHIALLLINYDEINASTAKSNTASPFEPSAIRAENFSTNWTNAFM